MAVAVVCSFSHGSLREARLTGMSRNPWTAGSLAILEIQLVGSPFLHCWMLLLRQLNNSITVIPSKDGIQNEFDWTPDRETVS